MTLGAPAAGIDTKLNDFIRHKHVFVMRNQVFWVAALHVCNISSRHLEGSYRLRRQDSEDECGTFHRYVGKGTEHTGPGSSRVTMWKPHITISTLLGI
jgi:hypothetical protein